jgi:hypothetical protein
LSLEHSTDVSRAPAFGFLSIGLVSYKVTLTSAKVVWARESILVGTSIEPTSISGDINSVVELNLLVTVVALPDQSVILWKAQKPEARECHSLLTVLVGNSLIVSVVKKKESHSQYAKKKW